MLAGRRLFLFQSGALITSAAATLGGCRESQAPAVTSRAWRSVSRTLAGMPTSDGAGVKLVRVIGQAGRDGLDSLDPFLLLDRIHSDDPGAYIRGFPDHPHRGFETVSVMLAGRIRHRDSKGNHGVITGGGAQWMTAGRGIVHSEMPEQEQGLLSGFQLWINLPAAEKMGPQVYQDLAPARLVEDRLGPAGSRTRLIAGPGGPVRERPTEPLLLTVALEDDRAFELDTPRAHAAFVYVTSGSVEIGPDGGSTRVGQGTLAVLGPGDRIRARATDQRSDLLVAAARPIGEPIVRRGPFVMNTQAEIQRAFDDYRAGVLDRT
jgi:redox-sensitive bicupin YhaK (pirin superfamily)